MSLADLRLSTICTALDSGVIRLVVDRVFPFESTSEALAYVETGRAKGKVVIAAARTRSAILHSLIAFLIGWCTTRIESR
jgi:hypothetical protein